MNACKKIFVSSLALALGFACQSNSTTGNMGNAGDAGATVGGGSERAGASGGSERAGASGSGGAGGAHNGEAGMMNGGAGASIGEAGQSGTSQHEFAYITDVLKGVLVFSVDPNSGAPTPLPGYPVGTRYTTAIAVHPTQQFLYLANDNKYVDTYRIATDGNLPAMPTSTTPTPDNLSTLTIEPKGRFAYAGSTNGRAIYSFNIDPSTGALSPLGEPLRIGSPPTYQPPGSIAADPSGQFIYISQMAESGPQKLPTGIRGYRIDPTTGALSEVSGSPFGAITFPSGEMVIGGAIAFAPSGDFLFNSGEALSAFSIDKASGSLTLLDGSPFSSDVGSDSNASNLAVDPHGDYLYVTNAFSTQHISGFAINPLTGALNEVEGSPFTTTFPFSIAVDPSGRFVYVGNDDVNQTSVYALDRSSGKLTAIDGSPFMFGGLAPEIAFAAQ